MSIPLKSERARIGSCQGVSGSDKLVNEVWVAVAGRVPTSALRANSELKGDHNVFKAASTLLDIVISCRYRAFEVGYACSRAPCNTSTAENLLMAPTTIRKVDTRRGTAAGALIDFSNFAADCPLFHRLECLRKKG
jgi:hypothetical protein